MKQCPNCKNTYTDESLKFCLADGAQLISLTDAEKTIAMSATNDDTIEMSPAKTTNPVRVDIPKDTAPESVNTVVSPQFSPPQQQTTQQKKGVSPLIVGALVALLLLVIVGFIGFAGYVFFKPDNKEIAAISPTPAETQKPTPDDDNEDLKEKIAELEKKIESQKTEKTTTPTKPISTEEKPLDKNTARVNSPRDGFLALRSEPDTETGFRVMKIPHNATVKILSCRAVSTIGKTRGRWCLVTYTDQTGGFLTRF